jgi:hypothetical protein
MTRHGWQISMSPYSLVNSDKSGQVVFYFSFKSLFTSYQHLSRFARHIHIAAAPRSAQGPLPGSFFSAEPPNETEPKRVLFLTEYPQCIGEKDRLIGPVHSPLRPDNKTVCDFPI